MTPSGPQGGEAGLPGSGGDFQWVNDVINFIGGLFGGSQGVTITTEMVIDPNSPYYDENVAKWYRCQEMGGQLMNGGVNCIINQGGQQFDLFAAVTWKVNRVYVVPGAVAYPPGSPECQVEGAPTVSPFPKPGADACYRPEDSRVELISPGGKTLTLTFYQWKAVVDGGGVDVATGEYDPAVVQGVTGVQLNPDGTTSGGGVLPMLGIGALIYFLT